MASARRTPSCLRSSSSFSSSSRVPMSIRLGSLLLSAISSCGWIWVPDARDEVELLDSWVYTADDDGPAVALWNRKLEAMVSTSGHRAFRNSQ